ncbi:uncharacterized protein BXZ73DRAFT_105459 [Epithele typhae]|uniref:uncharacterized protein n=1 Tax=Epithele typhae TaxID=378194 RepID=UPI002008327E|nr:uncharacterized protein BXZ73DRAFT_105459 [Epithele typhae]KAH9917635.1 hypothetical protein BXZ73DRAFT_105459 [Epithele typhae]
MAFYSDFVCGPVLDPMSVFGAPLVQDDFNCWAPEGSTQEDDSTRAGSFDLRPFEPGASGDFAVDMPQHFVDFELLNWTSVPDAMSGGLVNPPLPEPLREVDYLIDLGRSMSPSPHQTAPRTVGASFNSSPRLDTLVPSALGLYSAVPTPDRPQSPKRKRLLDDERVASPPPAHPCKRPRRAPPSPLPSHLQPIRVTSSSDAYACPIPSCGAALHATDAAWRTHFKRAHHNDLCAACPSARAPSGACVARCPMPGCATSGPGAGASGRRGDGRMTLECVGRHWLNVHIGVVFRCPVCGDEGRMRESAARRHSIELNSTSISSEEK